MFARALLLVSLFGLPVVGFAEPAVVRVFEAPARTAPDPKATVIHVFVEGTEVSVSEEPTSGFRKVRLPDGQAGYIEEGALAFPKKEPPANSPKTPPPASPNTVTSAPVVPDLRPRIYVKDLDHLTELVQTDSVVESKASSLARRRTTAMVVGLAGGAVGGVVFFTGLGNKSCSQAGLQICTNEPTQSLVGIGIVTVSALAWWIITPGRKDLIDVINAWNMRHVDQQFEIATGTTH